MESIFLLPVGTRGKEHSREGSSVYRVREAGKSPACSSNGKSNWGPGFWGEVGEDDPREAVGGQVYTHRGPAAFIWQLLLMTPPPLFSVLCDFCS